MKKKLNALSGFTIPTVTIILLINQISFAKTKPPTCKSDVQIQKISGIKTSILEKPLDKHLLKFDNQSYYLMINKNHDVIFAGKNEQMNITSLKHENGKPAYYIEIDWMGDSNQDCKLDLVLWKKLGIYIGTDKAPDNMHEKEGLNEKLQITSQPSLQKPYLVESLGKY